MSGDKFIIVNGDDFGASRGINRGILEAHIEGILTSTSLMVNMPAAEEAADLAQEYPSLSVGLHVNLTTEDGVPIFSLGETERYRKEIDRQMTGFQELLGCMPTHLDAHHNMHRSPTLVGLFQDIADQHDLPLREHSRVLYFPEFYGQWDGETHPEQISVTNLIHMLECKIPAGVTELSCHPGYRDRDFQSSYSAEREIELRTLCDPLVRAKLQELRIVLISYRDLGRCFGPLSGA